MFQNEFAAIVDFIPNTSIVAKRNILPLIKGRNRETVDKSWYEQQQSFDSLSAVYNGENESTDFYQESSDFIKNGIVPPFFKSPRKDPYSKEGAQIKYLQSKPVCYVIFGKPGLESEKLAELIADSRNCVLISASKISRELKGDDQKKSKQDLLKCGCDSLEDLIWNLILDRVNRRDVWHKGYVLEGLPLINNFKKPDIEKTNSTILSTETTVSVEYEQPKTDYVLITMPTISKCEISSKSSSATNILSNSDSQQSTSLITSTESVTSSDRTQSLYSMLPSQKTDSFKSFFTSEPSTKSSDTYECACAAENVEKCSKCNILFQLEQIFDSWRLKPDIIINVTCSDEEILAKYRVQQYSSSSLVEQVSNPSDTVSDLSNISLNKCANILYNDDSTFAKIKYFESLTFVLHIYKQYVTTVIQKYITRHNPQNIMCIDGRYPIEHIFQAVILRIQSLPLQMAITPEKVSPILNKSNGSEENESEYEKDGSEMYENESFDDSDDNNFNIQDAFNNLKHTGSISDMFPWKLSRWKFFCPVELAKGKKIEGKKKLAVRFMNWIFFLSSNEAMEAFIDNPRPYLLPPNPRPSCRIAVIGPRYSGKTELSLALAKNLDSVVINVRDIIRRLNRNMEEVELIYLNIRNSNESVNNVSNNIIYEIIEILENLPEQKCGEFTRNRGWILDNVTLDYELCKKFLENDISLETVIILFESDPYSNLIEHWHKMQGEHPCDFSDESNEYYFEEMIDCLNEKKVELNEYIKELKYFNTNAKQIADKLLTIGVDVILCDLKFVKNTFEHAISHIRREYQLLAEEVDMDEEDSEEDHEDSENDHEDSEKVLEDYEKDGDMEESGEGSIESFEGSEFSKNSRLIDRDDQDKDFYLGDCKDYCPIALLKYGVLWKGSHKYRSILDNELYFMSSESALNSFIFNYLKLGLPLKSPIKRKPPLRIFIIGPPGSGKSSLANLISKEYGLFHVDVYKRFNNYMANRNINTKQFDYKLKPEEFEEENSEDSLDEFQFPESLQDIKYNNDELTITNFFSEYHNQGSVLPSSIANECILNFFHPPFTNCGIIMDSFPNCVEDFEVILEQFAIPEVIIELKCLLNHSKNRLINKLLSKWKIELRERMEEEHKIYSIEMEKYLLNMKKWIKNEARKIFEARDECSSLKDHDLTLSKSSMVSDSTDIMSLISGEEELELENQFCDIFPKPEFFSNWESEESVIEYISMQVEEKYEKYLKNLSNIRNFLKNETIPWIQINGGYEIDDVLIKTLYELAPFVHQTSSFFEKTYIIDIEIAEKLLSTGYYFLSSLGRFCPVQAFYRNNPFPMFLHLASDNQIYSVLYRQYIYFLAGKKALKSFQKEPLKYLKHDNQIPIIPVLMSVIGPPKCGKSTISKQLSMTYGVDVISREEAISYVLSNFPCINLTCSMRNQIQKGEAVTSEQLAEVIELFLTNSRCLTQGCVFDGFPESTEEAEAFIRLAINPRIVIDLQAPFSFTLEHFEFEDISCYCNPVHYNNYQQWEADAESYRTWLNELYGNVLQINATESAIAVWKKVDERVRHFYFKFLQFIRDTGYDKVRDLQSSCLTPRIIQDKASRFRLYCPSCIHFEQVFNVMDISQGRRGLLEFRDYVYWFCESHASNFIKNPLKHLELFLHTELPDDFPQIIFDIVDLKIHCWSNLLANHGYCLVTYIDNIPHRSLVAGRPNLGAFHKGALQLFCTEACRRKFCREFRSYERAKIHLPRSLENCVDAKTLPVLGFLEQSVAAAIARALNYIAELRPMVSGLSAAGSAAVFMGTYMMAHHNTKEAAAYQERLREMEARLRYVREMTDCTTIQVDPWTGTPMVKRKTEEESKREKEIYKATMRPSLTVKFKRTSDTQIMLDNEDSDS